MAYFVFQRWFATEPSNMAARTDAVPEPPSPDSAVAGDESPSSQNPTEPAPGPGTPPPDVDIDGDEPDSVPSHPSRPQEYEVDVPDEPVLSHPDQRAVPAAEPSAAPSSLPRDGQGSEHELASPASSQAAGEESPMQQRAPHMVQGACPVHLCALCFSVTCRRPGMQWGWKPLCIIVQR